MVIMACRVAQGDALSKQTNKKDGKPSFFSRYVSKLRHNV